MLKGQIIGNGFTDWKYDGFPAFFNMAYYHGLIDDELFDFGSAKCNFSYIEVTGSDALSEGCRNATKTFMNYTFYANKFDIYARCHKNQSVPCMWTKPIVEYFNRPTVK